jgi:hypothetical protein
MISSDPILDRVARANPVPAGVPPTVGERGDAERLLELTVASPRAQKRERRPIARRIAAFSILAASSASIAILAISGGNHLVRNQPAAGAGATLPREHHPVARRLRPTSPPRTGRAHRRRAAPLPAPVAPPPTTYEAQTPTTTAVAPQAPVRKLAPAPTVTTPTRTPSRRHRGRPSSQPPVTAGPGASAGPSRPIAPKRHHPRRNRRTSP